MSFAAADRVAAAVLYEGYSLYPYRASALKNRQRLSFGGLYPRDSAHAGEAWMQQTECLVRGGPEACLEVRVGFLHHRAGLAGAAVLPAAHERRVELPPRALGRLSSPLEIPFRFGSPDVVSGTQPIEGVIRLAAAPVAGAAYRVTLVVENRTAGRYETEALREERVMAATHTVLAVTGGEMVSLLEPPDELQDAATACRNVGTWPVLVGAPGTREVMLSSPIILYDYPEIAPESPTDFFDASEMDEMLALRILTLTDAEKREIRDGDPRTAALLDRIEGLSPAARGRLHGAVREWKPSQVVTRGGRRLQKGDRVRLRPRGRGDIFDIALRGRIATVASVEQDFEGRQLLSVTVDDDPGRDLGAAGQPGHRFFFAPEDVEPL